MRRIAYWLILLPLFLVVIVFAINNSAAVDISLWPVLDEAIVMPAHLLVLIGLFIGFLFGGLIAWMQGGASRARQRQLARQLQLTERELSALKERLAELQKAPALPGPPPSAG